MGTAYINLEKWRGKRDATSMEPETMAYREQIAPARRCKGCCFDGQWSDVCKRASAAAVKAGMTDCDHGVIYILVEVDPRQLSLAD